MMNDKERIERFMSEIARLSNQVVDLQNERDALEARLEAMAVNRDAFREAAYKAISIIQVNNIRLPQGYGDECLRDLQAEAGRAGFIEGVRQMCDNEIGMLGHDAESCANHYAAKVRLGGN